MDAAAPPVAVPPADGMTAPPPSPPRRAAKRARGQKEAAFWEELRTNVGAENAGRAREFLNSLVDRNGLHLRRPSRSIILKMKVLGPKVGWVSFLVLHPDGGLNNDRHLISMLERRGLPSSVANQIARDYWKSLHDVEPRFAPGGRVQTDAENFVPFSSVRDRLPELTRCVENAAEAVRAALAEAGTDEGVDHP